MFQLSCTQRYILARLLFQAAVLLCAGQEEVCVCVWLSVFVRCICAVPSVCVWPALQHSQLDCSLLAVCTPPSPGPAVGCCCSRSCCVEVRAALLLSSCASCSRLMTASSVDRTLTPDWTLDQAIAKNSKAVKDCFKGSSTEPRLRHLVHIGV